MMIRLADSGDAGAVQAIYGPIVTDTVISFEYEVPTIETLAGRIIERLGRYPWLVAVDDGGTVVGYAYAGPFSVRAAYNWSCESSIYLAPAARGTGVARRLYTALFTLLRSQGYRRVMAGISLPNAASVGLHEAMGFGQVGVYRRVGWKFEAWHDVGWWQLDLSPADGPPQRVRSLDELPRQTVNDALTAG